VSDDKKTQLGTMPSMAPRTPVTTGAPTWSESNQGVLPAQPPPSFVAPPDPLIGQVMAGRYLVQKKLGEGGMGAVYLAQHTVLEKAVALKVLHGEFARKPDLVERFMQEAKAASRIRHENVIDISDFGTAGENLVFFAMELLNGHDLHEEIARARLAKTRLPWDRSRKIFLQICAALSAAHAQGIVHRDLKPENIYLVDWLGHKDFVKLLDFGIAKLTEVSEGDRKLTRTGMLFGTPEYMSPEQARGENVDHRVDIYAMGCILYQLCTGRVPFEAENFMGILSLHLTEPPPPMGVPLLQGIGAPVELEYIVMKALSKSRTERWQTVDEMANAIRALHGEAAQPIGEVRVPRIESRPPGGEGGGAGASTGMRNRTEWKGNLSVPVDDMPLPPPPKATWPWLVVGALVLGGGIAVAAVALGGKKTATVEPVVLVDAAVGGGGELAALPAQVTIKLNSVPPGAEITDMTTKEIVGKTPFDVVLPGSREPRRFTFSLAGHGGKMIELIPDEDVAYTAELVKVAAGGAAPASVVEVVPQKGRTGGGRPGGGAGSATGAATGSASGSDVASGGDGPVTMPDGSGAGTGTGSGSGKKPKPKPGGGSASGGTTGSSGGSSTGSGEGSSGGSSEEPVIKIKDPFAGQGGGGGGGGDGSASGSSSP
jgi:serine/threonine protein kinase